jgi:hypothetical protein
MYARVPGLMLAVALMPMNLASAAVRAQASSTSITKASALKNVRVSSIPGWFDAVSDESSFRILFPGKPEMDDDVVSIRGFKFTNSAGKWSASCTDLKQTTPADEVSLRALYQKSMDAMTRNKTYLLASGDIFLNGRLGVEFRIRGLSRVSYTRAFVSGRRLYTISVSRDNPAQATGDTPADVQQFFDSFAYWD